jgi:hypothetical protein
LKKGKKNTENVTNLPDFNIISQQIKSRPLTSQIIEYFKLLIADRQPFHFTFKQVVFYYCCCVPLRANKTLKNSRFFKNQFFFVKGTRKLSKETDVVNFVRAARQLKLLTDVMLNKKQKILLKFSKKDVINDDTSSSCDSVEDLQLGPAQMLQHDYDEISSGYSKMLDKFMQSYIGEKLSDRDYKIFMQIQYRKNLKKDEDKSILQQKNVNTAEFLAESQKIPTLRDIIKQGKAKRDWRLKNLLTAMQDQEPSTSKDFSES